MINKTNRASLLEAKPSTNKTKTIYLFCICNIYGLFTNHFTELVYCQNILLQGGKPNMFALNDVHKQSFECIGQGVCYPPVMILSSLNPPLTQSNECDVSEGSIG